jgi:hypothetical protein
MQTHDKNTTAKKHGKESTVKRWRESAQTAANKRNIANSESRVHHKKAMVEAK